MGVYVNSYNINLDKTLKDENVLLMADLHGKFDIKIIDKIGLINPHHIVIAGDIMQGIKYNNKIKLTKLKMFLSNLKDIAPVIITLGNHDLFNLSNQGFEEFMNLESIKNVYPLYNSDVVLDNYHISNFTPKESVFDSRFKSATITEKVFLESFDILAPKSLNDSHIEELITHSPVNLTSIDINKKLSCYDYALCGHMHNGYIPINISNNFITKFYDKGIWEMPLLINNDGFKINPLIFKKVSSVRGAIYGTKNNYVLYLSNKYFQVYYGSYKEICEKDAYRFINQNNLTPIVITGGVNKYPFYPFKDNEEITNIKIKRKIY